MQLSMSNPVGAVALLAALFNAAVVQGAAYTTCPKKDLCCTVAIPATTISQGSGNIYVQITAPQGTQWVGFGTGTGMAGSNMFLTYMDGSGNMTLSPRRGSGHFTPSLDTSSTAAQLKLLAGSGIASDGRMVANFVCPNCVTWSSSTLELNGASDWIGAWKAGPAIASTNQNAGITQHDSYTTFQVESTQATVDSDSNPFLAETDDNGISAIGGSGGGSAGTAPSPSGNVQNSAAGGMVKGHGILMMVTFAVLFPLGAMSMPAFGRPWAHGLFQIGTSVLMIAALGLGIRSAQRGGMLFNNGHTVVGVVVVGALALQPLFGVLHHAYFKKNHSRGLISHLHIWWGRLWLAVGVINGGRGIAMTQNRDGLAIPYGVLAAVFYLAWFALKLFKHFSAKKSRGYNSSGSYELK